MSKHNCENIIFHCIDFRLIKKTHDFLEKEYGVDNYDIVSIAGSSKNIADNNEEIKKYLLKQIEISYTLHHSKKVVLIHHSDCGAYKGSYQFENEKEEKEKQIEDMKKSETIIKEKFPSMIVEKIWAQILENDIEFNKI